MGAPVSSRINQRKFFLGRDVGPFFERADISSEIPG